MNRDRHIYITTAVLAVVFATAINVLTPRDKLAGTIVHRETSIVQQPATPSVEASAVTSASQPAGAAL